MKILKVWLIILPMFTIACSDEYAEGITESDNIRNGANSAAAPANTSNPYDSAGVMHNQILEILDQTDFSSHSIEEITILIDSVSAAHPELMPALNYPALSTRLSQITWIINNDDPIHNVLAVSALSPNARTSFLSLLNSLLLNAGDPYENIHPLIVSYEASVLNNTGFSQEDKRIILTASAVARYAVSGKKRKDKDWETSVTNIVAAVSGAEQNTALGLKMAVTVEICQNNQVTH